MRDLQLLYRECGAETRDDYLRGIANENGLPIACVRKIADRLGEREDFGALILICETRRWGNERPCHSARADRAHRPFERLGP